MTAIAWILITLGGGYYLGKKKFLHCVAFVLAVVILRGVVGDLDPGQFIATHQNKITQKYERALDPFEDNRYRARLSRHVE